MSRAHIEFHGLSVGPASCRILDGLTGSILQGVTVLVGPNGAGKSTLLRVLATAHPCLSGQITILGHDPGRRDGRRKLRTLIGYAPQHLDAPGGFSVSDLVTYVALMKSTRDIDGRVYQAIADVGLHDHRSVSLTKLSGGMLRRAGIAQAIVNDPAVLLLDEPTAGLDPLQKRGFQELVHRLRGERTVVVTTHLIEDVIAFADSVLVLDRGSLRFQGSVQELMGIGVGSDASLRLERAFDSLVTKA